MIGVELDLVEVKLQEGEQFKPEFLKLNPCHKIPVLKDGDMVLTESRAMCTYLVNKYAPDNDQMYPKDPMKRGTVDCFLQFDLGTLYYNFPSYFYPVYFKGAKEFNEGLVPAIKASLAAFEQFIGDDKFLMGAHPGLVDVCLGTTLTGFEVFRFDLSGYPKIQAYYERFTALPEYIEVQKENVEQSQDFIDAAKAKRNA